MNGTSLDVTRAIERMPPMITSAVRMASTLPNSQPRVAKKLDSPPVTLTNWTYAWFA